jgi:hypothetical protein
VVLGKFSDYISILGVYGDKEFLEGYWKKVAKCINIFTRALI